MAKITINYDTETEALEVNAGGKTLDNVSSFSFFRYKDYDGDWESRISIVQEAELDGLKECTTLYASKAENREESKKAPGFFEKKADSLSKTLAYMLKRNR